MQALRAPGPRASTALSTSTLSPPPPLAPSAAPRADCQVEALHPPRPHPAQPRPPQHRRAQHQAFLVSPFRLGWLQRAPRDKAFTPVHEGHNRI